MKNKICLVLALLLISLGAYAQFPPTDLSKIKVSELSDQQIQDFVNQGKARGYSVEDGEKLALQMGLPPAEALLLKERLSKLQPSDSTKTSKIIKSNLGPSKPVVRRYSSVVDPNQPLESDTLEMVQDSVEVDTTEMELYGRSFFKKANVKLMIQATDARAPESYVLGPGDEIVVSVFGTSYANDVLLIDEKGMARVRSMGNIYLTGLTLDQARKLIRSKWGQFYNLSSNQLEISLTYSRVIRVNIVGEVEKPGTYELSALNSVFNALLVAQGPNESGSLRKIEVIRAGKVVHTFDTYTYLTGSSQTPAFSLADNDYVVVQPLGKVVKVEGGVRRPMYYEMKSGEGLAELFRYAGGLKGNAFTGSIQRNTFVNGAREVIEYNFVKGSSLTDTLADGDEIVVREMPDELRNSLEVKGAVNQPGKFSFKEGSRVNSLVQQAGGLKPEAFGQRAFLSRKDSNETRRTIPLALDELLADTASAANILLRANDQLIIVSKRDFLDTTDVRVIGAIRKPGDFPYEAGMTLADILLQAGGLKQEADPKRIEVVRLGLFDPQNNKESRVYNVGFDMREGVLSGEALNFVLQPYDVVYVRTLVDFLSPISVLLEGEFNYPGTYSLLSREERISDVIRRAGGLKPNAFIEAARFYRETAPGGQVLVDLPRILNTGNKRFDYRLVDGDRLVVPEFIPYVSIQGPGVQYLNTTGLEAVNAPYRPGLRANRYIHEYGDGFSDRASKKRVFAIAANDKVSRTRNFYLFKIYPKVSPGSTVYVAVKDAPKSGREKGEPVDWNRAIENTTIKLTGLATLIILLRQL